MAINTTAYYQIWRVDIDGHPEHFLGQRMSRDAAEQLAREEALGTMFGVEIIPPNCGPRHPHPDRSETE
jgi:hypothetical protein